MTNNFLNWVKNNKFASLVILVLIFLVGSKQNPELLKMRLKGFVGGSEGTSNLMYDSALGTSPSYEVSNYAMGAPAAEPGYSMGKRSSSMPISPTYVAPNPAIKDRKVITEASLSVQVENVAQTAETLKQKAEELNGYVVNKFLNRPEFGENATLIVRVPSESLDTFIQYTRENSIKIVNENISGSDITDQYIDIEERITQLKQQKVQLETIMKNAITVEDYMRVQPYVTSLQDQIDSLIGQNNYSDQASKISLVTVYLSTDELSLPYTPDLSWRPQLVFKNASRSLLITLQKAGSGLIWLGVYSILIVPALTIVAIIYIATKRKHEKQS